MLPRYTLLALASLLLAACHVDPDAKDGGSGDDLACPAIACIDGLTIDFTSPLKTAGNYKVTILADGVKTVCEATLPFNGCSSEPPCSNPSVLLMESGCALPTEEHMLTGLQFTNSHPVNVSLQIERDQTVVASKMLDVTYKNASFGDPRCNISCQQANEKLETTP